MLDLLFLETRDAVMGLLKTKEMQGVDLDSTEALTRMIVITSYSIHYTKLYDKYERNGRSIDSCALTRRAG